MDWLMSGLVDEWIESMTTEIKPGVVAGVPVAQAASASAGAPAIAPAASPQAAPVQPAPFEFPFGTPLCPVDYNLKGYHFDATVLPEQVVLAAEQLDREGFALDAITGVDWLAQGQMEVVYDYFHPNKNLRIVVRTRVPRDTPELPTISKVFPGANWHERETHDFFGIRFQGHPDLSPFLLPEDATYHPLRKDFVA
jgi:NADH-quinone oxidoreductase subunit C